MYVVGLIAVTLFKTKKRDLIQKGLRSKTMNEKINFDVFVLNLPKAVVSSGEAYLQVARRIALLACRSAEGRGETCKQLAQIDECLDKYAQSQEFVRRLKCSLTMLLQAERKLLLQVLVNGVPVADVAAKLAVSPSSAYRKLRAVRNKFAKALDSNSLTKAWLVKHFGELPITRKYVCQDGCKRLVLHAEVAEIHLQGVANSLFA